MLTFKDLVDLKADDWNNRVALEYGIGVEDLKDQILRRELRLLENRIKQRITKEEIDSLSKEQKLLDDINLELLKDGDYNSIYEPVSIDKFKIKITDTEDIVDSIAITGKIIVGANFSKSNLSDSYFCGCTFYQCKLIDVDFGNSVLVGCNFVDCDMKSIDFNGSTITRTHFYECQMNKSLMDYVALTDSMLVGCNISYMSTTQSRILFTGFNDCVSIGVNWKESDIVQCSFTNCEMNESDFKRVTLVDSILMRCSLMKCDFNSLSVTCITLFECEYDSKYNHLFKMESLLYSPSKFEWTDELSDEESGDTPWLEDE